MGRSGYPDSLVATRIALMYVAYTAAHPRSWIPNNSDVFRPWADRANLEKYLESDADEQLILYIPFTGSLSPRNRTRSGAFYQKKPDAWLASQ